MIASKKINPHPDYQRYLEKWSALYEDKNYDSGLAGYFLKKSHSLSERHFNQSTHFSEVLEVGAGTGMHIKFLRHSFNSYILTDLNTQTIEKAILPQAYLNENKVRISQEDATRLSFPDNSFDRVIAAHVLEHLYKPHEVLHEWARVLRPGGILTLILPCDPGCLWRLGRYAIARKNIIKAGIAYDYWMAREHVNPINNLVALIRHYFTNITEEWYPTGLPLIDLNLFYIAHIKV